ncbi:MAG: response regulator transcription factor [Firmicutes bacterium]|nr:response regulator transcription factor [Bacillota bacterium]
MKKLSVIVVDDHPLIREGLVKILKLDESIETIKQASSGKEAIKLIKKFTPDVILLDINMPEINGLKTLKQIKKINNQIKIIILTIHNDEEYLFNALDTGTNGYILKDSDSDTILKAIKKVYKGETYIQPSLSSLLIKKYKNKKPSKKKIIQTLTNREYEILSLIAKGLSNEDISNKLFISEKTVKRHISNLYKKLGVKDRINAAIFAYKNNIEKP